MRRWIYTTLLGVVGLMLGSAGHVQAESLLGLTLTQQLVSFDSATPGTISTVGITGLLPGDSLLGIDLRPATGQLYGLGSGSRLYTINPTTGAATQVGSDGNFALIGTAFGFDFNPTVDRIRVVSNADQNLRLNPNNGTLAGTDAALNPVNPNVVGSAYTNNFAGAIATTLYGIDSNLDSLATQNPPNNGTLNPVGALGFNTTDLVGFDISGASGVAFASFTAPTASTSQLFTINLATGAATLVGPIGGADPLTGLAAPIGAAVPEPSTWFLLATGLVGLLGYRWQHGKRAA